MQHTNDPEQTGHAKSHIYFYRVIKTITFPILYFTISSFFRIDEKYFVNIKELAVQEKGEAKHHNKTVR